MTETGTIRYSETNEEIFNRLDEWIKKYNTSPKNSLENTKRPYSLSIKWTDLSQNLVERKDFLTKLKNWAVANKGIVIVTPFAIMVFTVSSLLLKSPTISPTDSNTGRVNYLSSNVVDSQNRHDLSEITPGVYYVNDEHSNVSFVEEESGNKDETSFSLPVSWWLENSYTRNYVNRIIEKNMQAREKGASLSTDEISIPSAEPIEPSIEPSANVEETPTIIVGSNGIEIYIPRSVRQSGVCPNNTSYTYYYGRWTGAQRVLSEQWGAAGKPSSRGIATLNDRYLVAVAPIFGTVGDNIDIVLTDGQVIPATIADIKGTDATSQWGHIMHTGGVDIIEWEITVPRQNVDLGSWGNKIVEKIVNYGSGAMTEPVSVDETPEPTETIDPEISEPINSEEIEVINPEEKGYVEEKEATESASTDEQYIELYSEIYGLDEEQIYQILEGMTDGFGSVAYKQYNFIGKVADDESIICDSKEMAILLAIRDIYHNPENYGVTAEEIKGKNLYRSSSSYASQIEYLSHVFGVDSALNYSICQASCGFKSPMFLTKNNSTNIKIDGNYKTFPTVTAGFVEQTVELYELLLAGKSPIETIGIRVSNTPIDWCSNVSKIYGYVAKNYDAIFESDSNKPVSNSRTYALHPKYLV